ncbi:glutamate--cysteine ligase [Rhodoferax sp. AJA081-3]|uniref:glutamate--cysteine ligase n=1 Tax=Rhodoferax sp. AJA081-3 TaxID=2752316 RepID=UPI001ADFD93C|nr:glutamate--cysteine ligase [Rhodoferax sp. AJA081-3]QTN28123.1 glutamate--cysteine ligase [Rhodoferax sp. AJA081-3]
MQTIPQALGALTTTRIHGIRRGIEKESLRTLPNGALATTPHPKALGSALTHANITTDFSESQVELITGVHAGVQECLDELVQVQQATMHALGDDMLWVSSMPCRLPEDNAIPLGQYGTSNVGRAKTVYRMGLGYRYGRRMQTISGIHYNWSLPDVSSEQYFGLIRNFRRHAFLLLYLFGASPAVCSTFVAGRQHQLQALNAHTMYLPYATSLRMGRLGYQSDAQASLAVSYNSLQGYGSSLHGALTQAYPAYEAIGVRGPDGTYRQLATSLLQIENEFYGTIRPKRVIFPGERPLHALRERGVEYVEVRLMDLDPFETVGINAQTMRFLDVFLLHCLLSDSPPDSPEEIVALAHNQHNVAERGREPGLLLERGNSTITLKDWGLELVAQLGPIAQTLDAAHGNTDYSAAVQAAIHGLQHPETLPSARVLKAITDQFDGSFGAFARAQSLITRQAMLDMPWSADSQAHFEALARESWDAQRKIEAADTMPFDIYLQEYLSPKRLGVAQAV